MNEIAQDKETGLTPEDLQDGIRYELLDTLGFDEVGPFISEYYQKRRTPLIIAHIALSVLFVAMWVGVVLADGTSWTDAMIMWGLGFAGFLLLLPAHEALHGLAYRLLGATDIRYGVNWRKLYAYALAHRFVADTRQFTWVALTPFLVISSVLLVLAALLPEYRAVLLVVLVWHTMGTSGDFALLNYFRLHGERMLYTYDDDDSKMTYFYGDRVLSGNEPATRNRLAYINDVDPAPASQDGH